MNVQAAVDYLATNFNAELGLCGQIGGSSSFLSTSAVFGDGMATTSLPSSLTFEPNENIKEGYAFKEVPPTGLRNIGMTILAVAANLRTQKWMPPATKGIPFHTAWNDESLVGRILPFSKPKNVNVCFNGPPYSKLTNGSSFGVFSACPTVIPYKGTFYAPDMNYQNALTVNLASLAEAEYQVMNLYLRRDIKDAKMVLQQVADLAIKNGDGSVGFGPTPPYRTIWVAAFYHDCLTMQYTPNLPNGIKPNDFNTTLSKLQQSDGSLPDSYTNFTSGFAGDPVEATNTAVLPYLPNLQANLRNIVTRKVYTLASIPSEIFSLNPSV